MTSLQLTQFLQDSFPSNVRVTEGKDNIYQIKDNVTGEAVYLRYDSGLTVEVEGKTSYTEQAKRRFSFRNEGEMVAILQPYILQLFDGERRI
jgi:hypothetical protein